MKQWLFIIGILIMTRDLGSFWFPHASRYCFGETSVTVYQNEPKEYLIVADFNTKDVISACFMNSVPMELEKKVNIVSVDHYKKPEDTK